MLSASQAVCQEREQPTSAHTSASCVLFEPAELKEGQRRCWRCRPVSRNLRPVCEVKPKASNLLFKLNKVFDYHGFLNKMEEPNIFLFGCLWR
jgi:hypothetical protein